MDEPTWWDRWRWSALTEAQRYGLVFLVVTAHGLVNAARATPRGALYFGGMALIALGVAAGLLFTRQAASRVAAMVLFGSMALVHVARDGLWDERLNALNLVVLVGAAFLVRDLRRIQADEARERRKVEVVAASLQVSGRRNEAERQHAAAGHHAPWSACADPGCARERQLLEEADRALLDALPAEEPTT